MSFILDALRKSEHARQREKGPGLAEVAVAPPKPKKNIWASLAVGLLVVNLVAIGVLLLRHADRSAGQAATTAPAANSTVPGASPVAGARLAVPNPGSAAPSTMPPAPAPSSGVVPGTVPPVLQPALPAEGAVGGTRNPLTDELSGGDGYDTDYDTGYDNGAAYPTAPPGMQSNLPPQRRGTVVYEQLPEAGQVTHPGSAPASAGGGVTGTSGTAASSLPSLDELGGTTGLPELHVDIHVYSTKPQERFVFINSRRYKEGDALQEGPHVDRITPDGVELSYRGNRFSLPRQ
jgi:general secretion pathway protein B